MYAGWGEFILLVLVNNTLTSIFWQVLFVMLVPGKIDHEKSFTCWFLVCMPPHESVILIVYNPGINPVKVPLPDVVPILEAEGATNS